METIKISEVCSQFVKGFDKILKYKKHKIHLIFNTYHEKIVKYGGADPEVPGLFYCDQYKK